MRNEEIIQFLKTLKPKLEKDGIVSLGLFGSFARGDEDENIRQVIEEKLHKKVDIFDKNSNSAIKDKITQEACFV